MFTDKLTSIFSQEPAPARFPARIVEGKRRIEELKAARKERLGDKSIAEINELAKIQIGDHLKEQQYQKAYNIALDLMIDLHTPSALNATYKDKADFISRIQKEAKEAGVTLR